MGSEGDEMKNLGFGLLAVSNAGLLGLVAYELSNGRWAALVGFTALMAWALAYLHLSRVRPSQGNVAQNPGLRRTHYVDELTKELREQMIRDAK